MGRRQARAVGSLRLVLRPPAGELEVAELALEHDWLRLQEGWIDPQQAREYRITWACDPATRLHYTEDSLAGCRYVQFSGLSEQDFAEYVETARGRLPGWAPGALLAAVDTAVDDRERGRALIRLAVGTPVGDREAFDRVSAGLRDASTAVRELSIVAAFYGMDPALRPLLRSIADADSSADLRRHAQTYLRALDNLGVG